MKNFNVPDWDGNKAGDKASEAFAQVGKPKSRARKSTPKSESPRRKDGKKVANLSKAIKKQTPTKNLKSKVAATVKQAAKAEKTPKSPAASHKKATADSFSSKAAKAGVKSPKSPKVKAAKVASKPKKPVSTKKGAEAETIGTKKASKRKTPSLPLQVTSAKVQKLVTSHKTISPSPTKQDGKVPKELKKKRLYVPASPTGKVPTASKKAAKPVKSPPRKSTSPAKRTSPQKAAPKERTAQGKRNPSQRKPKAKITLKVTTKTGKIATKKTPSAATKSTTSPKRAASPQKKNPKNPSGKLNAKSVAIKKGAKRKPAKTKIKIAGLLGKKTIKPVANSTPNGSGTASPKLNTSAARSDQALTSAKLSTPADRRSDEKKRKKLAKLLNDSAAKPSSAGRASKRAANATPLREKMMNRLLSGRFRYISEELYTKDSAGAVKLFADNPSDFHAYHAGYRKQVQKWPMNPLTKIIAAIKKMPESVVVADFGCGEAELAKSVKQKVHSFDLVAANARVTVCDMAHTPLAKHSVDVAVFCLSLMGTNLQDYVLEASRVLKVGGTLIIAEVESRFDAVDTFIAALSRYAFSQTHQDYDHNLFYLWQFRKERDIKTKKNLPTMSLRPCLYKRR